MVQNDRITIALFPARELDLGITRGEHLRTRRSRKVHSLVELTHVVHRVDTHTITRCHTLEVLIHNWLNSRYILHTNLLVLSHLQDIIIGLGLHIHLLLEDIHLECQIRRQLAIGHASQLLVVGDLALRTLANTHRYGFGSKQDAIEIVVALLQVGHDNLHLVHLLMEVGQLCLQRLLLAQELLLAWRREEHQKQIQENYT